MKISKKDRELVKQKYNGLCAYTGKALGDDWQVDHVTSVYKHSNDAYCRYVNIDDIRENIQKVHDLDNLLPALKIVNHYKRSLDLEGFRRYMKDFHKRLAKLPKTTGVPATKRRIVYMNNVADAFDVSVDKPFLGKFYFEIIDSISLPTESTNSFGKLMLGPPD
ncbi:hypothetical protein [Sphingobacterium sp. LRF_L2]|uniref:hypothetical protein n=1 Tax=Sphingobacterium sp. LRF_L2 TaxID=3369421 RepID=UPI003F616CFE